MAEPLLALRTEEAQSGENRIYGLNNLVMVHFHGRNVWGGSAGTSHGLVSFSTVLSAHRLIPERLGCSDRQKVKYR